MWPFPNRARNRETRAFASDARDQSGVMVQLDDLLRARYALQPLTMGAVRGVQSLLAGGERSPFKGRGVDFEESRRYQAGDDVKYMDWRVTARTGAPHLKVFREERERPVFVLVDFSAGMRFGTKVAFKSVVAARAAGMLAWASHHRGDRVGAVVFSEYGHAERRPRGGRTGVLHVLQALVDQHALAQTPALSSTDPGSAFSSALHRVLRTARPGSLLFVLTDFSHLSASAETVLKRLSVHHDVVNILLYDALEQHVPRPGVYHVSDGVEFGRLDTRRPDVADEYRQWFQGRVQRIEQQSLQYGMGFFMLGTHESVDAALHAGLARVGARRRHLPMRAGVQAATERMVS